MTKAAAKGSNKRYIIPSIIFLLFVLIIYFLGNIIFPFFIAALLSYLLNPVVSFLEKKKIPRIVSTILIFLGAMAAATIFILIILPIVKSEIEIVINNMPRYIEVLQQRVIPYLEETFKIPIPKTSEEILQEIKTRLKGLSPDFIEWASSYILKAFSSALSFFLGILSFFIVPVAAFYLLKDYNKIKEKAMELIPKSYKKKAQALLNETDTVLKGFILGQLFVSIILSIIYSIGLWIIGVDMPVVIGILSGLANMVPYLGLIVGISTAGLMAFLEFQDFYHPLYVIILFGIAQGLEGMLISPRIVGERVGLHPLAILMAIFIGGNLFGFFGILLAVPVTAVLKVFAKELIKEYKG